MKITFKVFLACSLLAISVNAKLTELEAEAMWAQNYEQAQRSHPQIVTMRFGDGTGYATTEPNMKEIAIRRIINERDDNQLPADKTTWAPCQWNYKILVLFVEGVMENTLSCDKYGLEILKERLINKEIWQGFDAKIAAAIKDDKMHCDNVDFYNIVRKFKSDADWRKERIVYNVDMPYLQGYEPEKFYIGCLCYDLYCEPRIHAYNNCDPGVFEFNAMVPMTEELRERTARDLGVASNNLSQNLGILVEQPDSWGDDGKEIAFKPQWALLQFYNNEKLECTVECDGI